MWKKSCTSLNGPVSTTVDSERITPADDQLRYLWHCMARAVKPSRSGIKTAESTLDILERTPRARFTEASDIDYPDYTATSEVAKAFSGHQ